MITDIGTQTTADRLAEVYRTRDPIEPVAADHLDEGLDAAYRIQQLQVAEWVRAGDVVKGHKVGLASRGPFNARWGSPSRISAT